MNQATISLSQKLMVEIKTELVTLKKTGAINHSWVAQYTYQLRHQTHSLICGAIATSCRRAGYLPMVELGWYRPPTQESFLPTESGRPKRAGEFKPDISLLNMKNKEIEIVIEYESLNSSDERIIEQCPNSADHKAKMRHLVNCAYYSLQKPSLYEGEPHRRNPKLLMLIVTLPDIKVPNHKTTCLPKQTIDNYKWKEIFLNNISGKFGKYNYLEYFQSKINLPSNISFCLAVLDRGKLEGWLKYQNVVSPLQQLFW